MSYVIGAGRYYTTWMYIVHADAVHEAHMYYVRTVCKYVDVLPSRLVPTYLDISTYKYL